MRDGLPGGALRAHFYFNFGEKANFDHGLTILRWHNMPGLRVAEHIRPAESYGSPAFAGGHYAQFFHTR